jgi:hypothetical protein
MKYIVFQIAGGIGKNVIATAVTRAMNMQYPDRKIIILTAHPDIWINNPRVHRVIQFGQTAYFYDDFIKDKDTLIFTHDPYGSADAIYRKKHMSQVWCELCGVDYKGQVPELYFTHLERDQVEVLLNKTKPILLIQPFGGAQTNNKYSWARDIPPYLAQRIADEFKNDYRVIQIKREDQMGLNGVDYLSHNPRVLALALMFSDKRIFIDSYMQHAAAALGLSSHVFWIGNSPAVFGYEIHKNITTQFEIGSTRNSLYDPFDISGDPIQVATPPSNLFDHNYVLNILKGDDLSNPIFSQRETIAKVDSQIPKAPSISIPDITDIIPGIQLGEFVDVVNTPKEQKSDKSQQKPKK